MKRHLRTTCKVGVESLETREVLAGPGPGIQATAQVRVVDVSVLRRRAEVGPTPLDRMMPGQSYQGFDGGLYGNWSNQPPQSLQVAAATAAAEIRPLNLAGRPSPSGRIGLVAIGQSTTSQWFSDFQVLASANRERLKRGLFLVNGGQDGMVSASWAHSTGSWAALLGRVGEGRRQVQAVFLDAAFIFGERYGAAAEANLYRTQLATIIARARGYFPNLRLVYAFPFHWAGSASSQRAVTEPGAFDMQFGIRKLILGQKLQEPIALWGPKVWSQTQDPALYVDGVHFTAAGRARMTRITWQFLRNDPTARWIWR